MQFMLNKGCTEFAYKWHMCNVWEMAGPYSLTGYSVCKRSANGSKNTSETSANFRETTRRNICKTSSSYSQL